MGTQINLMDELQKKLIEILPRPPGRLLLLGEDDWRDLLFSRGYSGEDSASKADVIVCVDVANELDCLEIFSELAYSMPLNASIFWVAHICERLTERTPDLALAVDEFIALAQRFGFILSYRFEVSELDGDLPSHRLLHFVRMHQPRWRVTLLHTRHLEATRSLFFATFHYEMSLELWRWKYAHPEAFALGVFEDQQLVGHLGGMPRPILFFGVEKTAIQIGDVMVDVSRRGILTRRGPFYLLTATFLERCSGYAKAFWMIYGFPNHRHMRLAEHLGFYREVGKLVALSWPSSLKRSPYSVYSQVITRDNHARFKTLIDHVWIAMSQDLSSAVVGVRDGEYVLKRYLEHPHNDYTVLLLRRRFLGSPIGVVVVHLSENACDIVDIIAPLNAIAPLVDLALSFAAERGKETLVCQIAERFAPLFEAAAPHCQRAADYIPIAKDTWCAGPSVDSVKDAWWLMSGDMDFR